MSALQRCPYYRGRECTIFGISGTKQTVRNTGLLIFCGKKSKISRDFQGQIRGKIGRFRGIFAGRKSKFAEKSADFWYFCRKKVKIRRKIGRFRGIFAEKCQISKDFQRQILRKIGRFHGRFRGKTKTKTADFAGFLEGNFAKIDQFCVDMTSVG